MSRPEASPEPEPGGAVVEPEPGGAVVKEDGTWTDPRPPDSRLQVVSETQLLEVRHVHTLQNYLLAGLGALIVLIFFVVVIGVGAKAISEDFAKTLAQMTIPALLTFGGTIVGTLFAGDRKK